MTDKIKNLLIRSVSGIVLGLIMLGATIYSHWTFGILMLAILVVGMHEFYELSKKEGCCPQKGLGIVLGILFFVFVFMISYPMEDTYLHMVIALFAAIPFCLLFFTMFIVELFCTKGNPFANLGSTLTGFIYVALPIATLTYLPAHVSNYEYSYRWSPWIIIIFFLLIWANDVFAYLTGMAIGKHPLFPRISPKKSWEGFVGGIIGAVGVGIAIYFLADANVFPFPTLGGLFDNPIVCVGLALVVAVTGVFGDLVESMFKRSAGVKDSGNLIPGHGGVLDRFDSMLMAAPFTLLYIFIVMESNLL